MYQVIKDHIPNTYKYYISEIINIRIYYYFNQLVRKPQVRLDAYVFIHEPIATLQNVLRKNVIDVFSQLLFNMH